MSWPLGLGQGPGQAYISCSMLVLEGDPVIRAPRLWQTTKSARLGCMVEAIVNNGDTEGAYDLIQQVQQISSLSFHVSSAHDGRAALQQNLECWMCQALRAACCLFFHCVQDCEEFFVPYQDS